MPTSNRFPLHHVERVLHKFSPDRFIPNISCPYKPVKQNRVRVKNSMASVVIMGSTGLSHGRSSPEGLKPSRGGRVRTHLSYYSYIDVKPRRLVLVRAEAINPEIRKTEEKVVDSVIVSELSKPLTAYCRCWRSGTFPLCDGSHVKHNKATGDNVGPLLLKKQKQ